MRLLHEVSSSVIKNTYKVFTKLLYNNDATKGEQVMTKNGEPVLVMGGAKQTVNQFCERMLADALFHNNADRRFEPGAARIAITDCNWNPLLDENPNLDATKLGMLKDILNYITENHNDRDIISNDLNGKTYQELYDNYEDALKQVRNAKNAELNNIKFKKPDHKYKIIRIDSFKESQKYYDYTNPKSRWCLTYSIENYNGYMNYDKNTMYFCLRDDIDTVEYKVGERCPLDEYGKSMLCVIVNPLGELSTFTTRWNHKDANGKAVAADRGVGDKITISKLIGANFNDVFVPDEEKAKLALEMIKRYHLDNIDDLNEDDSLFANEVIRNLDSLNDELVDGYDPDSDETNPDDMSWSDVLDHIDWDFGRAFGQDIVGSIDAEKTAAYENTFLICTTNNYFKLMCPILGRNPRMDSITNWCDDIKPIYTKERRIGIFAIKEHNSDYYKFIAVDINNGNLRNLEVDFENKILLIHEPNDLADSNEIFITLPGNNLGLVVFSQDHKKASLKAKDIDLPESYIVNNNYADLICGESRNDDLLFKIKNNDSGKFNLIYQKHGFKLELAPEDEFEILDNGYEIKRFVEKNSIDDITTMNVPVMIYSNDKRYLIDLKTFKPLFDKKGNVDNTGIDRLFFRATDEEKFSGFRDELNKHNLEMCYFNKDGSIDIGKIDNIYCCLFMYCSIGDDSKYKGKTITFGYTDPECTKIEIFDIEGNILYKSEEPIEYFKNMKTENKRHVKLTATSYGDLKLSCFYEHSSYVLPNDVLREISKNIASTKNESIILKYAAYLLG
ncbi:MAG: hypothetical protein IJH65_11865 [Methanobrevibacter sp.]|nr:hypothetical protein [Methanobrevibacter sp.]